MNRIFDVLDLIASRWLDWRTSQAVQSANARGEMLNLKRATVENGTLDMVMAGPAVIELVNDAAAILNQQNAKNYVEFEMMPRLDRAARPIRVTIQWANGLSPAQMCEQLRAELETLRAHDHEWSEAHAMLTGKFEIGFAMTHPEGAHTELGKAAEALNVKIAALEADLAAAHVALEQARLVIFCLPEWNDNGDWSTCYLCNNREHEGHTDTCPRQVALGLTKKP